MFRTTISISTLALLAACATPNPPTVTAGDVNRAFVDANAIRNSPFTDTENLPTGDVTYTGKLGADISGDLNGAILGDLSMQVDFATNDIDGAVTNINLIDPVGRPDQRLDGQLFIAGTENNGRLDGFASGDLQGVDNGGFAYDTNVLLVLDGDVFDDQTTGDSVFGSAQGDAIGDVNFDVDGVFFGTVD